MYSLAARWDIQLYIIDLKVTADFLISQCGCEHLPPCYEGSEAGLYLRADKNVV